MFKCAFLLNSETLTPENYSKTYENSEFYCKVVGTNSMEQCERVVEELAGLGVEFIDLCGDFDQEKAQRLHRASGGRAKVCFAKYSEEEKKKVEAIPTLKEYAIIICAEGITDRASRMLLTSGELNTHAVFVADDEMAVREAKKLAAEGIQLIELCSYFTEEKGAAIIKAIEGRIPIGYCG